MSRFWFIFSGFILFAISSVYADTIPELLGVVHSDTTLVLFGERIEPLGDQNNDGYDDFLVTRGGPQLFGFVFLGGDPIADSIALRIEGMTNILPGASSDLNGDTFRDILGYNVPDKRLNLYYGGPILDEQRDFWFGTDSGRSVGYPWIANDLNNSGYPELISASIDYESVLLFELGMATDSVYDLEIGIPSPPTLNYTAANGVAVSDFNGDGFDDIAMSFNPAEQTGFEGEIYLFWGGPQFDTLPDLIISRPGDRVTGDASFGRILEPIGDFDGDGFQDILAGAASSGFDSLTFVFLGGPDMDSLADFTFYARVNHARTAGDVNSDTYDDFVASFSLSFGGGPVRVYFGGPSADDIPDIVIPITNFPLPLHNYGLDCSGVGDVNGDGIDDFAFSAIDIDSKGVAYVYSGISDLVSVDDNTVLLPSTLRLHQNYPNPFNPSTTIEYSLPARSEVTLTVFNSLGQKVAILVNEEKPAGTYQVHWNGRDEEGHEVASGVYLYRLMAGEEVLTRKMTLVK